MTRFLAPLKVNLIIHGADLPKPQHQHDNAIMDYFNALGLRPGMLPLLTHCKVYLQLIFLSDIASADGKFIVPSILDGHSRQLDRNSRLTWPH